MKHFTIPTCYFPSTVMFVDDSHDFLMNFTLQLPDNLIYQTYQSPLQALEAIKAFQTNTNSLDNRCISEYFQSDNCPLTNQTVNIDLSSIHWEIYNPGRFREISVIVVDYAMPGMDGLAFCKALENTPIKKILLTGQADQDTAIEAFNNGLIDQFIKKNNPNVIESVNHSIQQLQKHYFQNMSYYVNKMLSVTSPSCLQDEKFATFFKQICEKYQIVEFYLMENSGSFLLLDEVGKVTSLLVKNQENLRVYYEIARDNKVPKDILEALEQGTKIPYFWNIHESEALWNDWASALYPAQSIQCDDIYYYAIIEEATPYPIQKHKITSFKEYLIHSDIQENQVLC